MDDVLGGSVASSPDSLPVLLGHADPEFVLVRLYMATDPSGWLLFEFIIYNAHVH